MKNNILILDDEINAANYLKESLEEAVKSSNFFNSFSILTSYTFNDFLVKIREYQPSIIFLDIQMPVKDGIEVAEYVRQNFESLGYSNKDLPIIVYCSAYDNYGYKAFSVDASDYILKPISDEVLIHTLNKIESQHKDYFKDISQYIKVPTAGIGIDFPINEVIIFKAEMKYINVISSEKEFLINDTLLNLESLYQSFIRVHRSFLINPNYIQKFYKKDNNWFLSLKNYPEHIPVSRRHKKNIETKIDYTNFL